MAVTVRNPQGGAVATTPSARAVAKTPTARATGDSPDTDASVTGGTPGAVVIPTGKQGPPGPSAYEIAVENGFVGTELEWLAEVEGDPGLPGPPGPPGPQGDPGAGTYYAEFGFATPSTTWTIVHNQDSFGISVETVDVNGDPMEGYVKFLDANTLEVDWYYPTAGTARIFR